MVTKIVVFWLFAINAIAILFGIYGLGVAKRWWK